MAKETKIRKLFDFFLKDFEPDANPQVVTIPLGKDTFTIQEYRIDLPASINIYQPFIVFIIFVYLKEFPFYGKEEKVAWTIPIKYKGEPFLLTHRKFGFRIISNKDTAGVKNLAIEAMTNISKAIPYAEVLFEPVVKSITEAGNVTLTSQYIIIEDRYRFFRDNARKEYKKYNTIRNMQPGTATQTSPFGQNFVTNHNLSYKHYRAGKNHATAMLDSYFCLIEHTCVLLLPFIKTLEIEKIGIEKFIGLNWKEKLKTILPLATNKDAQKLFDRLYNIKEDLRNPLTHGYFLKEGYSFFVHVPNIGAIPMGLTQKNKKIHFAFSSIGEPTFQEICKCFDDFDNFLATNEITKYGYAFVKTGLDIYFDKSSVNLYHSAMTTMPEFEKLIEYIGMQQDNTNNMDW